MAKVALSTKREKETLMNAHAPRRPNVRDEPPASGDSYARGSFTWRRMKAWQVWTLAIVAAVVAVAAFVFG